MPYYSALSERLSCKLHCCLNPLSHLFVYFLYNPISVLPLLPVPLTQVLDPSELPETESPMQEWAQVGPRNSPGSCHTYVADEQLDLQASLPVCLSVDPEPLLSGLSFLASVGEDVYRLDGEGALPFSNEKVKGNRDKTCIKKF